MALDMRQAARVVLVYNDNLVLVNQNSNYWVIPGGGIDAGETPKQALLRELNEELSLSADDISGLVRTELTHEFHIPKEEQKHFSGQKSVLFFAHLKNVSAITIDPKEIKGFMLGGVDDVTFTDMQTAVSKILQDYQEL